MKVKALLFLFLATSISSQAITISQWTFETAPPLDLSNSTNISGINADVGSGTASGVHASATTDWTTPTGNGSANSLSVNTWGVGDYFQFQMSSVGYENIKVSWDQTSSGTGPRDFSFAYSTDGSLFSAIQSYAVLENASSNGGTWGAVARTNYSYLFDLGSFTSLDDSASVYFRLIDQSTTSAVGGTVASGGSSRIDNFTVSGDVYTPSTSSVPDSLPSGFAAATLFGFLLFSRRLDTGNLAIAKNRSNKSAFRR